MAAIAMIGGDQRQIYARKKLELMGFQVSCWGLGEADTHETWQDTFKNVDCVLLPIPTSEDGIRVRCPLHTGQGCRFTALLEEIPHDVCLVGGALPPVWVAQAEKKQITCWDYNGSEVFQLRNAGPTAEGAILLAMQALKRTVNGLSAAILGYGRIASLLAEKLKLLGADVTVYARKARDLAHAELRGIATRQLSEQGVSEALRGMNAQVVFNTVPQQLVTEELLQTWNPKCVLVELASAPGGFHLLAVERLGFTRIHGAALPGRLFPETAGEILAETVAERLNVRNRF